jgi:hypothetical protein
MPGTRHSPAATIAAGAALLVAAVSTAGLLGARGGPTHMPAPVPVVATGPTTPPDPGASPPPAPARVGDAAHLDLAELPTARVSQAAALLALATPDGPVLVAFDDDERAWVRLDLPVALDTIVGLSPDGRRVLTFTVPEAPEAPEPVASAPESALPDAAGGTAPETTATEAEDAAPGTVVPEPVPPSVAFVDLGTGQTRQVPLPAPPADARCAADAAAWATNSRHVAVVVGCARPGPDGAEERTTTVHEVDLVTGRAETVDEVAAAVPAGGAVSWSPDGRRLAFAVTASPAPPEGVPTRLRVHAASGDREWPGLRLVGSDPWVGVRSLLAVDDAGLLGDAGAHLVLDARTGEHRPAGVTGVVGTLAGQVVVGGGACPASLCRTDLGTGETAPWLTTPDGVTVLAAWTARDLDEG